MATATTMKSGRETTYLHTCGRPNDSMEFDATYMEGALNGMTVGGYKSSKLNPTEWGESNYTKYYQSFADREGAQHTKLAAEDVMRSTLAAEQRMQLENTKKLAERLKDINYWKSELNRQITDMITETDQLVAQKKRLENSLRATEIPLHIATDNMSVRQRRQGADLVQDEVELCLLKEIDIINKAQDLLTRTIKEADQQIKCNRDHKQILEFDWSDKKEADEIDTFCVGLRNEHTCKQFYPGSAKFQEVQSNPESWAKFSHDNICGAELERQKSTKLRTLIDNILQDVSRDMKDAADAVDAALRRRIAEVQEAKDRLEKELKNLCAAIVASEKVIDDLKNAIKAKDDPMKVAQTRLHKREFRPNVDLCRDPPQYGLINEVHLLEQSTEILKQKLIEAENDLKVLQDQRMTIEKDISCKKNSLFIDREKVMPHRTRYPTVTQLQGY